MHLNHQILIRIENFDQVFKFILWHRKVRFSEFDFGFITDCGEKLAIQLFFAKYTAAKHSLIDYCFE